MLPINSIARTFACIPTSQFLSETGPWVCFELKENARFSTSFIKDDWDRLEMVRKELGAKRGYLIYLARRGNDKNFFVRIPHRHRCLVPMPIAMEAHMEPSQFGEWEQRLKAYSRLVLP
jgi:hypothetical protein